MNITKDHISYKKVVGKLKGKDVWLLGTTGGLHLVCCQDRNGLRTLGAGPHKAVARFIAEKQEPSLIWTELSKSDSLDPVTLAAKLPEALTLTRRIQSLEG